MPQIGGDSVRLDSVTLRLLYCCTVRRRRLVHMAHACMRPLRCGRPAPDWDCCAGLKVFPNTRRDRALCRADTQQCDIGILEIQSNRLIGREHCDHLCRSTRDCAALTRLATPNTSRSPRGCHPFCFGWCKMRAISESNKLDIYYRTSRVKYIPQHVFHSIC